MNITDSVAHNKLIVNSLPKSGTHLLKSLISHLGVYDIGSFYLTRDLGEDRAIETGDVLVGISDPRPINIIKLRGLFSSVSERGYVVGHVAYNKEFTILLKSSGFKTIIIIRDPIDVALSYVNYMAKRSDHYLNSYFCSLGERDRLDFVLNGSAEYLSPGNFVGINEQYESFRGWLDVDDCCVVTFEDLIGNRGGGDQSKQLTTISKIVSFLGINTHDSVIESISHQVFDVNSPTFFRGEIGSARKALSNALFNYSNELAQRAINIYAEFVCRAK